jgi:transcriptional antiterminator NusG
MAEGEGEIGEVMTNTYAINTTRNQEFRVESELQEMGLHPWVPRFLASKYIKENRKTIWYDRAYIPKLMFCVIPAVYWRDVVDLKHVIGKPLEFSRRDIEGVPAHHKKDSGVWVAEVPGFKQFKAAVEAEYSDRERLRDNSEYQCQYQPGQALIMLSGAFDGFEATFKETIKRAHDDYHKIRVSVELFGRESIVEVDPDKVGIAG